LPLLSPISVICSLNRRADAVPLQPVVPKVPFPSAQTSKLEAAGAPPAMLEFPVVLLASALVPLAVLLLPVVLAFSASKPLAVLLAPVVLSWSAWAPLAVLDTEDQNRIEAAKHDDRVYTKHNYSV
jgi:hypothetical protein